MVRKYKRKTEKASRDQLKLAVISVLRDKKSLKSAASLYGVSKTTLHRWVHSTTAEQAMSGDIMELKNAGHTTVMLQMQTLCLKNQKK